MDGPSFAKENIMTPKPPAKPPASAPAAAPAPAPAAHPEPTPAPKKLVFANLEHSVDAMDSQRVKIAKLEKNLVDAKAELDEMIRLHNLLPK